jgi:DNA-binding response OmpR family regulator
MTIRILAVDDEADILRLVRIKLEKAGFERYPGQGLASGSPVHSSKCSAVK